MKTECHYLLCLERSAEIPHWWRKGDHGYTQHLDDARVFSFAEAARELAHSRGGDVPIPFSVALMLTAARMPGFDPSRY